MPEGRDGTWMYMNGYHGIQQLFSDYQLLVLMCSIQNILEAFLELQKISEVFSACHFCSLLNLETHIFSREENIKQRRSSTSVPHTVNRESDILRSDRETAVGTA